MERFGYWPVQDDLARVNCWDAGDIGHSLCGVCAAHDQPRFMCGCPLTQREYPHPIPAPHDKDKS